MYVMILCGYKWKLFRMHNITKVALQGLTRTRSFHVDIVVLTTNIKLQVN